MRKRKNNMNSYPKLDEVFRKKEREREYSFIIIISFTFFSCFVKVDIKIKSHIKY